MDALQRAIDNVRAGRNVRAEPEDGDGELDGLSRDELYERAQAEEIPGRTKMSKKELVDALTEAGK
jgi:DNA end-binding protein Ku